jgi:hypothetical protein
MPKTSAKKLAWQEKYNKTPEQVKRQTLRRAAERAAVKSGASPIGDGKDIAHKRALDNAGANTPGNVAVQDDSKNRAWRKGRKGYSVPNT